MKTIVYDTLPEHLFYLPKIRRCCRAKMLLRMLGDYGLATHRGLLTHIFQPANPVAFDIKTSVQNGLQEK